MKVSPAVPRDDTSRVLRAATLKQQESKFAKSEHSAKQDENELEGSSNAVPRGGGTAGCSTRGISWASFSLGQEPFPGAAPKKRMWKMSCQSEEFNKSRECG
uniref:Uncharacterized protein n=1 Tax=Sphaerodactylus townsendi TaxID=933632 RepID=A0ACB8F7A5_9SAUR